MERLREALDALASVPAADLPDPVLLEQVEGLIAAKDRLDGLLAERLVALDRRDVTVTECGRSTRGWLVEEQRRAPSEAGQLLWAARRYGRHPLLSAAVEAGEVSARHTRAILDTLDKLPASVETDAEAILVDAARTLDPGQLGRLTHELLIRTGAEDTALEREQRKFASRWASAATTFEGMVHVEGMLDPVGGQQLLTVLRALSQKVSADDDRTGAQRTADALTEVCGHYLRCDDLPDTGGLPTQVTVTIDHATLTGQVEGWGLLEGGIPLSAAAVRRLACEAELIPAVLGGDSEILDIGRTSKTWTRAQRRAARLRDRGCTFPGCQAGLHRCELHHIDHWSRGGATSLHNSAHLCAFHHWLIHHENWHLQRQASGELVFTAPDGHELRAPPRPRAA